MPLLLILIGVPTAEIILLMEVGSIFGVWATLGLIVATALLGSHLLRQQGASTLARLQEAVARNEPPIGPLLDGFCLLTAGLVLLTPGFLTDFLGLLLLIPSLRRNLGRWLMNKVLQSSQVTFHMQGPMQGTSTWFPESQQDTGPVIDAVSEEIDNHHRKNGPRS